MIKTLHRVEFVALSDVGKVRHVNEDSWFADPARKVFAVADGMGGFEKGEWASQAVVEAIGDIAPDLDFDPLVEAVAGAVHAANARIFAQAQAAGANMGTTLVSLCFDAGRFGVLWAGDSRAYIRRHGALLPLTRDHTRVQELIDRGFLTPEQARGHPMGHVLSRAIGVEAAVEVEAIADTLDSEDVFLLCSDGLYGVVTAEEMAAALGGHDLGTAAQGLIDLSLARGAPDNVTLILVRLSEATALGIAGGKMT